MKKTLLLVLLFSAFIGLKAQYQVNEGFETPTFPPTGWVIGTSTYMTRSVAASGYGVGSASARYNFYNANAGVTDSLVTFSFTGTGATDSLSFDHAYATYSGEVDQLNIYTSTDGYTYTLLINLLGGAAGPLNTGGTVGTSQFTPTAAQWATKKYSVPLGTVKVKFEVISDFGNNLFLDNIKIGQPPTADVAAAGIGASGSVFFGSTTINPTGTVQNNGLTPATFVVTRTISGGYVSTIPVVGLAAGASTTVTFDPWTFVSGNTYTVRDSTYMVGDSNPANDTLQGSLTPQLPKTIAIVNADNASRDSLIAHMTLAGITSDYYDILTTVQSFRLWRTTILLLPSDGTWSASLRDSIKAAMDNANDAVNKKAFLFFGNDIGYQNDPKRNASALAADTLFYRQYLKAVYNADNWLTQAQFSASKKYKGVIAPFTNITADSCNDAYPDAITPATWYGGQAALVPIGESGDNDTCNAVVYNGTFYNMFYATNVYSKFVPTTSASLAPQGGIFNAIQGYIEQNGGQLPVELASFTSSIDNRKVTLNWSTVTEENNAGFEIERKLTGATVWTNAGHINGAGNSNTIKNYTFTDNNLATGKYNYRLKQVDFNGNFEYFNLSNEVNIGVPNKFALSQNYPNPFNPTTNINYDLPFDSKVMIKIFDITGREVSQIVNTVQPAGYYSVNFNASVLSSGVYFYQITADGGNQSFAKTLKMMLIK